MTFLVCFDKNYFFYWNTLIYSILKYNKNKNITFLILTDWLEKKQEENIKKYKNSIVDIKIINIDINKIRKLKVCRHFNKYIYLRLLIDQIPNIESYNKITYLDSDMLCNWKIDELDNINLGNDIIWAVEEPESDFSKNAKINLGLDIYFNSWLIIINVKKWLEEKISEKSINFINENKEIIEFPDQDALNFVLKWKVKFIDEKFNFMHSKISYKNKWIIIHYAWDIKPWKWYYFNKWWFLYIKHFILANKKYYYLFFIITQFICKLIMKNKIIFNLIRYIYVKIFKNA